MSDIPQVDPQSFLDALGAALSLPRLSFNEDRVCCLFVPGELEVQIEWANQHRRVVMLSPLGPLGADPDGAIARELLSANFLFQGTRGETLSFDPDSGSVFLCLMLDLDAVGIDRALEAFAEFVDTAGHWRHRLQIGAPGTLERAAPPMVFQKA